MLTRCLAIAPEMKSKILYLLLTTVPLWLCSFQQVASAQLSTVPKPSPPTPTNIQPNISSATQVRLDENQTNQFNITGGYTSGGQSSNVIHQFDHFDIGKNDRAHFIVDPSVANVISLIDAENTPSIIDGTLATINSDSANLVLVNPAGIVFGENFTLQLDSGNLTAAASSGLLFEDRYYLSIDGSVGEIALPESDIDSRGPFTDAKLTNLTGDPTGYFLLEPPAEANATAGLLSAALPFGSIHNRGSLNLPSQSTLTLVGQYIQNDGDITANGGSVNLAAATASSLVRLSQAGNIMALELVPTDAILLRSATGIPEALTGGGELGASQIEAGADGTLTITDAFSPMPEPGEVLVRGTIDVSDSDGQGTVNIAGEYINLVDSEINADGSQKAGVISIGNDNETGIVTITTSIDRSSDLSADSTNGEGGVIRIRATETIQLYGDATVDGANPTLEGNVDFQAGETLDVR
ncbi:MAG: filamentous hemagglutinin N-terminal domain-containing protein [Cyanobacteria bacterium P01_D01_bin.56]